MKYKVVTNELEWHTSIYIVEANSEDEIRDMSYDELQPYFYNGNYDSLDRVEIDSIKLLDESN